MPGSFQTVMVTLVLFRLLLSSFHSLFTVHLQFPLFLKFLLACVRSLCIIVSGLAFFWQRERLRCNYLLDGKFGILFPAWNLCRCSSNVLYCSSSRLRACELVAVLSAVELKCSLLNLRNSRASVSSTARSITVDTPEIVWRSTIAASPAAWTFSTLECGLIFRFCSEKLTDICAEVLSTMWAVQLFQERGKWTV